MSKKVLVYLATGFEEAEAIIPVDMFRRAGYEVVLASIQEQKEVVSSHNVKITADKLADEVSLEDFDAVFLPGGMPGSINLSQSWLVNSKIIDMASKGRIVSAICAAPSVVLANAGLLDGKRATCYPGCEKYSKKEDFSSSGVEVDGNIITGKSAGYAFDIALAVIKSLSGADEAEKTARSVYFTRG